MENIGKPTSSDARTALDDIDRAQRAVRDTPWPVWLYPANALLLGAMALTPLLADDGRVAVALAVAIVALNMTTGYRMGTPWALPTSRGFLASVALSAAFVATALAFAPQFLSARVTIVLALAAATTYSVGSALHYRSTHR